MLIGGETVDSSQKSTFGGGDDNRHGRFPSTNDGNYAFSSSGDDYDDEDCQDYVRGDINALVGGKMRTNSRLDREEMDLDDQKID